MVLHMPSYHMSVHVFTCRFICPRVQACSSFTKQPIVTPCAHLLCLHCTACCKTHCPLPTCRRPYEMQAVQDPARLSQNENPKWTVPKDLIELQVMQHEYTDFCAAAILNLA